MACSGNDSDFIDFSSEIGRALPLIHVPDIQGDELRLVLVGKVGVGKSSTANTILGRDYFKSERKSTSVTKRAKAKRSKRNVKGKSILVIDTPGLYDTTGDNCRLHVKNAIENCIALAAPGIHAIIFVLSTASRFTNEDQKTFQDFFDIFGERFYQYAIVVFTYADLLKDSKKSLQDYIGDDKILQAFLQKCGNRMVAFNNKDPAPLEKETQRDHLISIVIEMNHSLHTYYTNHHFADAEKRLRKMEKAKDKEKAKKLEELRQQLEATHAEEMKELIKQYNDGLQILRDQIREILDREVKQKEKDDKPDKCIVM